MMAKHTHHISTRTILVHYYTTLGVYTNVTMPPSTHNISTITTCMIVVIAHTGYIGCIVLLPVVEVADADTSSHRRSRRSRRRSRQGRSSHIYRTNREPAVYTAAVDRHDESLTEGSDSDSRMS